MRPIGVDLVSPRFSGPRRSLVQASVLGLGIALNSSPAQVRAEAPANAPVAAIEKREGEAPKVILAKETVIAGKSFDDTLEQPLFTVVRRYERPADANGHREGYNVQVTLQLKRLELHNTQNEFDNADDFQAAAKPALTKIVEQRGLVQELDNAVLALNQTPPNPNQGPVKIDLQALQKQLGAIPAVKQKANLGVVNVGNQQYQVEVQGVSILHKPTITTPATPNLPIEQQILNAAKTPGGLVGLGALGGSALTLFLRRLFRRKPTANA